MNWFQGNIALGIAEAKKRNVLFVVYINDESEDSKKMDETWESNEVSKTCEDADLVIMRFRSDSNECKQFSQIYVVLVVPSVYFISGQSGVLLEGSAGAVEPTAFIEKIHKSMKDFKASLTSVPSPSSEATPSPPQLQGEANKARSPTEQKESLQERAARLRQKMEEVHQKKQHKKEEEIKSKEIERRQVGQAVQKAQQKRAEEETKSVAQELRKQKMEDKLARQKVRDQIARDRAEKQVRFSEDKRVHEEARTVMTEEEQRRKEEEDRLRNASRMENARLQFRLPDGSTINKQFPSSSNLREVEEFVQQNITHELKSFILCTTFPRRQFSASDMDKTLLELELAPSAAIAVLPSSSRSSNAVVSSSGGSILSWLLAPLLFVWNLISWLIFGSSNSNSNNQDNRPTVSSPSPSTQPESSFNRMGARPKSSYARRRTPAEDGGSVSRREGNIHRFNTNDDDDDDENNTWNGNSTQQM